jgi:hypothetical protein
LGNDRSSIIIAVMKKLRGRASKRSQMDIKRKICDIRTWERNIYFSTYPPPTLIHLSHRPVRRNPQHISLLTVVSATSAPPFQPLRHHRNVGHTVLNRFTRQTLPTVNRKHFFLNILCIYSFCQQQTHNRTLLFGITHLKHGRNYMRMPACYLDCNEAGLCCYLVIHTENPLRQLQLFYFNLWPIYLLSRVWADYIRGILATIQFRIYFDFPLTIKIYITVTFPA